LLLFFCARKKTKPFPFGLCVKKIFYAHRRLQNLTASAVGAVGLIGSKVSFVRITIGQEFHLAQSLQTKYTTIIHHCQGLFSKFFAKIQQKKTH